MSEPRPVTGPVDDGLDPLGDGERLPWLEPYREPKGAPPEPPIKAPVSRNAAPRRSRSGWLTGGVLAAILLAGGSYWFGRQTAPRDVIRPQTTVIAPLPPSAFPVQPEGEVSALPYRSLGDQPVGQATSAQLAVPAPRRAERHARTSSTPAVTVHRHAVPPPPPPAPPQPRVVAQAAAAPPPAPAPIVAPAAVAPAPVRIAPNRPTSVRVAAPPPAVGNPGEAIELGIFISRATAQRALHRIVRRYPYLGTRPKMILSQPPTAGWPQVYRLRLGTGSARNARILCRYVHTIGKRCSVV